MAQKVFAGPEEREKKNSSVRKSTLITTCCPAEMMTTGIAE